MANHHEAVSCACEPEARAVDPRSCTPYAPDLRAARPTPDRAEHASPDNPAECHFPRAERTRESVQAEQSYRDLSEMPPSQRPLAAHRLAHATALFETLRAFDVSKSRFADMIGVNEKQVRKMLEGLTPIQSTVASAMPSDMALDFLGRLTALRGGPRAGMQREIERLRTSRDLKAVYDAQRQLLELATELAAGGAR
jgi:hypothetical protein